MHIRYKPRINLGSLGITRESIDYATRYARLQPQITTTYVAPVTNKISPPAGFYETPTVIRPDVYYKPLPIIQPVIEQRDYSAIPEPFRYSKEQIMDMLARGASETFERTGETDSGLPVEMELEQISRELDATKQYAVDADGTIVPTEPRVVPGAGVGWLAAAVVGFLLFGG